MVYCVYADAPRGFCSKTMSGTNDLEGNGKHFCWKFTSHGTSLLFASQKQSYLLACTSYIAHRMTVTTGYRFIVLNTKRATYQAVMYSHRLSWTHSLIFELSKTQPKPIQLIQLTCRQYHLLCVYYSALRILNSGRVGVNTQ